MTELKRKNRVIKCLLNQRAAMLAAWPHEHWCNSHNCRNCGRYITHDSTCVASGPVEDGHCGACDCKLDERLAKIMSGIEATHNLAQAHGSA